MRRRGTSYGSIFMALLAMAAILGTGGWFVFREAQKPRSRAMEAELPKIFMLPRKSFAADDVIGRTRADVHAVLGEPTEVLETVEEFRFSGVPVRVRWADGKAVAFLVTLPNARRNERALRKWVSVPPIDPIVIGGRRYTGGPLRNEEDTFGISPERVAAEEKERLPKREQRHTAALLKAFPEIPAEALQHCTRARVGGHHELTCVDGFDAKAIYEFDEPRTFTTLTVLGPPSTPDEGGCRKFLKNAWAPGPPPARYEWSDQFAEYYESGGNELFYSWLREAGKRSGAACTVMACRPGASGLGRECRPRNH